jgi:MFS transporter, DHA3 family, multidrug efflux protein
MTKTFYAVLANSLAASLTNTFVWFAVTFWVYLETKSVIATSVMAGVFTLTVAFSGFFLGSLVDRYHKKTVMLLSSLSSFVLYTVACIIYTVTPKEVFKDASSLSFQTSACTTKAGALCSSFGHCKGNQLEQYSHV